MLNYQRVHSTWENTNFSNRWVPKNFLCRAARWWGPRYAWPPAAAPRHIWHLRSREGHWAAAGRAFHGNMGAATWRLCRARIYQYFIGISAYQYHRIYIYMTYMIYIYIYDIYDVCIYIGYDIIDIIGYIINIILDDAQNMILPKNKYDHLISSYLYWEVNE
jgi:hypothetical protein